MTHQEIEQLAEWSELNESTGQRSGIPSQAFWSNWNRSKDAMKRSGLSVIKEDGKFVALWTPQANQTESFQTPHEAKVTNWSDEQTAIHAWFKEGTGNLVVRARAGTGKTHTSKAGLSLAPESRMLYAVFNKKNQLEAQGKITDRRVEVKTLHGVGYACILRAWGKVQPDDVVEYDRTVSICGNDAPDEVLGAVQKLVGFLKNAFTDIPTVEQAAEVCDERTIEVNGFADASKGGWTTEKLAFKAVGVLELSKVKDELNRISFNDMVWLPVACNMVSAQYDLVLIDEAQDMNAPQLEMAIRSSNGRVCVVGDDRQCIYGFRGAVQDGLGIMKDLLQASELGLTTTYRCPKSVVSIAQKYVPDYKAYESSKEGTVDTISDQKFSDVVKVGDAVLSRNNAQLMPLCLSLLRKNIPARVEGRDVGRQLVNLACKLNAKSVPNFLEKLQAWGKKQKVRFSKRKNSVTACEQIDDQVETLTAIAEGLASVDEIKNRILNLFQDSNANSRPAVVLSTVHKAKGLEWSRVFLVKSSFLKKINDEEENIYYVAVTRAMDHLTFIS